MSTMTESGGGLRVLVTAAAPGDAVAVVRSLREAGHTVLGCHGGERCPLALGRSCPLADDHVDAVVHVRARPAPLGDRDRPFLCAVVAGVPVVLCGYPAAEGPWARADAHCSPAGVAAAVERAVRPTSRTARRWIELAVADVLRPYGLAPPARLRVTDGAGAVDVELAFVRPVPVTVRGQLQQAVRAALAPLTPHWAYARVLIVDAPSLGTKVPDSGCSGLYGGDRGRSSLEA